MYEEEGADKPELWETIVIIVICLLVFATIIFIVRKALVGN
ncbi:MAG: hypothetical protein Q7K43_06420 [Candidatus Woesearchaeota archaeon]|nr:hypothetical protein [Candidatus Woesearchaeota archaeon]